MTEIEDWATLLWLPLMLLLLVTGITTNNGWPFWVATGLLVIDTLACLDWRGNYKTRTHNR